MKSYFFAILLCALAATGVSGCADSPDLKLTGINGLPGDKSATFIVVKKIPGRAAMVVGDPYTLKVGQRQGVYEVLGIDPLAGVVRLKVNGTELSLRLVRDERTQSSPNAQSTTASKLQLRDMALSEVLQLYAHCSGRTVLHPTMTKATFTLTAPTTNREDVVSALNNAFKEKGIVTVPDGDKFVRVMPENWKDTAPMRTFQARSPAPTNASNSEPIIPAGDIDFPGISLVQVLEIYAKLAGGKGIENDANYLNLPPLIISFKTETPLTSEEVVYAFDTLFYWDGFKIVPSTGNMLKVVWISSH